MVGTVSFPSINQVSTGGGSLITRALIDLRRPFSNALASALAEPEAALAQGILLGERATIPADVTDDFNRAGISHLVAISGSNIAILIGLLLPTLAPAIGKRRAIIVTAFFVVTFAFFVGSSPSVIRAAAMGVVLLGAMLAGSPNNAGGAIVVTAALMTIWNPLVVHDVAFQLSFAATVGLAYLATPLKWSFESLLVGRLGGSVSQWLAESMAITTAASLAVLPITAANFGRISHAALPANLLAVQRRRAYGSGRRSQHGPGDHDRAGDRPPDLSLGSSRSLVREPARLEPRSR